MSLFYFEEAMADIFRSTLAALIYTLSSLKSTLPSCRALSAIESFSNVNRLSLTPPDEKVSPLYKPSLPVFIVTSLLSSVDLLFTLASSYVNKSDSMVPSALLAYWSMFCRKKLFVRVGEASPENYLSNDFRVDD